MEVPTISTTTARTARKARQRRLVRYCSLIAAPFRNGAPLAAGADAGRRQWPELAEAHFFRLFRLEGKLRPPCFGAPMGAFTIGQRLLGGLFRAQLLGVRRGPHHSQPRPPLVVVSPSLAIGVRDLKLTPSGKLIVDIISGAVPGYIDGATITDVAWPAATCSPPRRGGRRELRSRPGERPVLRAGRRTLPCASAHLRLLVSGTKTSQSGFGWLPAKAKRASGFWRRSQAMPWRAGSRGDLGDVVLGEAA